MLNYLRGTSVSWPVRRGSSHRISPEDITVGLHGGHLSDAVGVQILVEWFKGQLGEANWRQQEQSFYCTYKMETCNNGLRHSGRKNSVFCFFNWSIIDLQYCVNFRCTSKWFWYIHIYIFYILLSYRLLLDFQYSSLCYRDSPFGYLFYT